MYDLEKKVIFTHPPKCAGTTIEVAFKWHPSQYLNTPASLDPNQPVSASPAKVQGLSCSEKHIFIKYKHASLEEHISCLNYFDIDHSEFFKFTCVRNPWDIAVSRYLFNVLHSDRFDKHDFKNMTFSEWLNFRFLEQDSNKTKVLNLKPFTHFKDEYAVDFVVRFENYRDDFEELVKRFDITYPEKKYNSSGRAGIQKDYRIFYKTDKDIQLVADTAKDFIELFNYTF
jgi:hypothetical protein